MMKIFDVSYLKPKKLIPIVLLSFIALNVIGYVLAINSTAHVIAKKAIKEYFLRSGNIASKVTLLPWGFKIKFLENDGDAHFIYYVTNNARSEKVSVSMVKKDGEWKVTELSP